MMRATDFKTRMVPGTPRGSRTGADDAPVSTGADRIADAAAGGENSLWLVLNSDYEKSGEPGSIERKTFEQEIRSTVEAAVPAAAGRISIGKIEKGSIIVEVQIADAAEGEEGAESVQQQIEEVGWGVSQKVSSKKIKFITRNA